jgi:RNA polymerase sigma factor (sigma-70 family)
MSRTPPAGQALSLDAFAKLVDAYHVDLLRLAYGMSGDRLLAEDAVQACWQSAWRSRGQLRDPAVARGWLCTIAANEVRRHLRRRRLGNLLHARLAPAVGAADIEPRHIDLATALSRLPLRDRQLIGMRYDLQMTSDEIAPHLGMTASGTRVRLKRVIQKLREDLSDV